MLFLSLSLFIYIYTYMYILSAFLRSELHLLVTANFLSSMFLFTLMMEVTRSSEPFLTRAARRHISEDGILQASTGL
jgi:hypothetical protein